MKAAEMIILDQNLKTLKLPAILGGYKEVSRQAKQSNEGYEKFLLSLTEREIERRQTNQLQRRLKEARFPQLKPFEKTDLDKWPSINPIQIREYAQGDYIQRCENLVFIGQHGTGKTHAAIALGIEACRQGYRTFFTTAASLVNTLVESREERWLQRFLKKLAKYQLLIIDELGYIPFSQQGAQLLFQVFSDRYEAGSMIVTSNLAFAEWNSIFNNANLTGALLDRLTHRGEIHQFDWPSIRFTQSLKRQKKKHSSG